MSERPYFGGDYTPEQIKASSRLRPIRRPRHDFDPEGDILLDPRAIPELSLTTDRFQQALRAGGFGNVLGVSLPSDHEVARHIYESSKEDEGYTQDAAA